MHPNMLAIISHAYPLVEFGVLFRPDKEGQPRYASQAWVARLSTVAKQTQTTSGHPIKLAAHLCSTRVNEVLSGDVGFVQQLQEWGFQRVQVNATAVNGVDTSRLAESPPDLVKVMESFPSIEFILQKNEETRPLWEGVLQHEHGGVGRLPQNVTMLVDESKGTGVTASSWPSPPEQYDIGYAGGIGPQNIRQVVQDVQRAAKGRPIWIDMESSLRSDKNGKDVFDLDKCYEVIDAMCELGFLQHPSFMRL